MPVEYRRVLEAQQRAEKEGLDPLVVVMASAQA
jgi:hypothetical protein